MADRADAAADAPAVPAAVRPAGAAGSVTVREYGTRYLRISVRYHGDGRFSWLRVPGPAHDRPQVPPPPAVGAALRRVDAAGSGAASGARLALGERAALGERPAASDEGGGLVYRVPGAVSVARLLPSGDETGFRLSVRALSDVGRTLRHLHDVPWEFTEPAPPHHGVGRLLAWISGAPGEAEEGARLRALVHDRLGPRLWTRLTEWAEAARQPPGRGGAVLLHGAPSTGWLVPSPAGDHSVLLTGEEVTGGDPALDLGWILGELHELRSAATRGLGAAGQGPPVDYPAAARALLAGYLRKEDGPDDASGDTGVALPPGTARAATLRLAIHMRDFASFVGWHDDLRRYADLLAETLDADGAPTLRW
ncbi:hypothetical protein GCM10011583_20250 [Streptomyces camponoticapitis]|uniref:Aminoglycoside phosphotransferase domain-containing protein n=1 Tax=Streptomyces camponoticapitis TaxID=1616125 RepID=A0ABQ2E688_9ACTN|nr:hypothetical protein [Streptomyces camponoticapitis]GGJ88828.1 hypothetical protein GCM10011583_20250 [Streptomyces camponoticapitis]